MIRITLLASGTRGDVQPYIALGLGLNAAGYAVTLATHAAFRSLVERSGLHFALIEPNPTALMMQSGEQMALTYEGNAVRALQASLSYWRNTQACFGELLDSAWQACRGSAAIIAGLPTLWGMDVAAALQVPCIWAFLQPFTRTSNFAHPMLPFTALPVWPRLHQASYRAVEWAAWLPWRAAINQWRGNHGLPPAPMHGRYRPLYQPNTTVLYGFSRHIVPTPQDWPAHHHSTGYWFWGQTAAPNETLHDYVAQHPRLIYVGVGSMQPSQTSGFIDSVSQALAANDAWAVMLLPSHQQPPRPAPPRILFVNEAPHVWLFPHMRVIVHHGGAGTTATAFQAGQPQIITPIAADQFFWANRAHAIGVSPPPIPLRQLNANNLSAALAQSLNHISLQQRAQTISQQLSNENGVQTAVQTIASLIKN